MAANVLQSEQAIQVSVHVVYGRRGWRARYLKEVDASETTLRFWQEIYDEQGKLTETHDTYPVDRGHQKA